VPPDIGVSGTSIGRVLDIDANLDPTPCGPLRHRTETRCSVSTEGIRTGRLQPTEPSPAA